MSKITGMNWSDATQYDGTRTGLTEREFSNYVTDGLDVDLSDQEMARLFGQVDANNDGKVYQAEMSAYAASAPTSISSTDLPAGLENMSWDGKNGVDGAKLEKYDGDRVGLIKGEFRRYLDQALDVKLDRQEIDDLFDLMDLDGNGRLTETEIDGLGNGMPTQPNVPNEPNDNNNSGQGGEVVPANGGGQSGSGQRYDVRRTQASEWSDVTFDEGSAEIQYESLDRPYRGSIDTDGADYILIIKSGGKQHHSIDNPTRFFGTNDGDIVGVTGSKDKGMMLIDVAELDQIDMNTGNSSVQIMRIRTDEELTVLNDGRGALDNDLVRGGSGYSREAVEQLGYDIDHRRVEAWNDSDNLFTIYADDESKYDHRVEKYGGVSEVFYYGGDDSAYVLPPGAQADTRGSGSGNGAIIHLGVA